MALSNLFPVDLGCVCSLDYSNANNSREFSPKRFESRLGILGNVNILAVPTCSTTFVTNYLLAPILMIDK